MSCSPVRGLSALEERETLLPASEGAGAYHLHYAQHQRVDAAADPGEARSLIRGDELDLTFSLPTQCLEPLPEERFQQLVSSRPVIICQERLISEGFSQGCNSDGRTLSGAEVAKLVSGNSMVHLPIAWGD